MKHIFLFLLISILLISSSMADTLLTIDGSNYIGKVIEKDAKRQLIVFDDGKNVFGFSLNVVKSIIYTDGATWLNPHTSASITNKSVSAMPNRTKGIGNYQILYHNKTETSSYAQVEYHLLISPYISRSELESILLETLNLSKEAEFKQHEQTTQVYIYVFTSEKRYKRSANPYVAHLNWNIRMSEVQLEIKDDLLGRELPEYPTIAMASNEQEQHHIFLYLPQSNVQTTAKQRLHYVESTYSAKTVGSILPSITAISSPVNTLSTVDADGSEFGFPSAGSPDITYSWPASGST